VPVCGCAAAPVFVTPLRIMSEVACVQDTLGLIQSDVVVAPQPGEPKFFTRNFNMGYAKALWDHLPERKPGTTRLPIRGSATDLTVDACAIAAFGELIERYCVSVYTKEQFIVETAAALGKEALDLSCIPRCSPTEIAHSKCNLIEPSRQMPMRWTQGLSLRSGGLVYLPSVMVFLYLADRLPGERIAHPISTGCAAHRTYEEALIAAILEVVERDALSILWLQQLPVPRFEVDQLPPPFDAVWESFARRGGATTVAFFDATTDLDVPVVYGVRSCRQTPAAATMVACASALEPAGAVAKVIRDLSATAIGFRNHRPIPNHPDDFTELHHGSVYMARAERAPAFDFLLQSPRVRSLMERRPAVAAQDRPRDVLKSLLSVLFQKGLEVFAVDLTTDEALRAGLRVVRVIIPGLQPFSCRYRARYLAHARLYEAPAAMDYPVRKERELNPWPNPFA
jgi:ribosomal protein S12 methylthiotransferase accessory factor